MSPASFRFRPENERRLIAAMTGINVPGQGDGFVDNVRETEAGNTANEAPEKRQKEQKEQTEQKNKKETAEAARSGDETVDAYGERRDSAGAEQHDALLGRLTSEFAQEVEKARPVGRLAPAAFGVERDGVHGARPVGRDAGPRHVVERVFLQRMREVAAAKSA